MYRFNLPIKKPQVIELMDALISKPLVVLPDANVSRSFGIYIKPLRKRNIIGIYHDTKLNETVAVLKVKNIERQIGKGGRVEYLIPEDSLKVNIKIPDL